MNISNILIHKQKLEININVVNKNQASINAHNDMYL